MFLTSRDREMLQWINGHGFVTANQAAVWMGVCDRVGRRRLRKLVEGGYLQKKRFEFNDPQFHWLTKKGWQASGDSLAPPKRINRVTYFHDKTLVDLAQQLVAKTKGDFIPERRLRADRRTGWKRRHRWTESHVPDGLLYIGDDKPVAIELEISLKERSRLREIILDYAISSSVREIRYFVTNGTVRRAIERATKIDDDFRIFTIDLSSKRLSDDSPTSSSDGSKGMTVGLVPTALLRAWCLRHRNDQQPTNHAGAT